jgi:hypothetical protein
VEYRMIARFVKWFKASVWPWIVEHIWPELRTRSAAIFEKIMDDMAAAFWDWWASRQSDAHAQASRKATEAESMAEKCATEDEAGKHREIAKVWREVAESFRLENEELKTKLNGREPARVWRQRSV